jgi:hypothetical protein
VQVPDYRSLMPHALSLFTNGGDHPPTTSRRSFPAWRQPPTRVPRKTSASKHGPSSQTPTKPPRLAQSHPHRGLPMRGAQKSHDNQSRKANGNQQIRRRIYILIAMTVATAILGVWFKTLAEPTHENSRLAGRSPEQIAIYTTDPEATVHLTVIVEHQYSHGWTELIFAETYTHKRRLPYVLLTSSIRGGIFQPQRTLSGRHFSQAKPA